MKISDIPMCRLHNQQLEQARFKKPSQLVSWLGAVQAQDYPGSKWSLGLRLPDSTDAIIEQAISEKKVVRTWLMRGTLHFVAASDLHWMLALLAPRIISRNARRYRELELDELTLARSNEVLENALQSEKELSRRELLVILEQNGISTTGQRAAYMLQRASLDGLICQSVAIRNNPTYLSLNSLTRSKTTKPEDALVELAKRYFTTRGPATLQDYVWWSGLLVADARAGLEAVKSQLVSETINGTTYWRPSSTRLVSDNSPTAHLLPGFDEFLLSYKDRSASLDTPAAEKVTLGNRFKPTIIINGRVVGTWKRVFKKNEVIITSKPFKNLSDAENNALSIVKRRFGEFLGMSLAHMSY